MEKKAVMLVNDLPGVTKVALGAMIFSVLQAKYYKKGA